MLRHICLSVCHTAVLCQNEAMQRDAGMQSSPSDSPVSLVSWCQEWLMGDDPVRVKFECTEVNHCENSRAVHILPHNSGSVTDNKKNPTKVNRKSTMGFPTSHQPRSIVTPNFPTMGFRHRNSFFKEILTKPLKARYKVSLSENYQCQSCSAINHLSNGINNLAGDDPVP